MVPKDAVCVTVKEYWVKEEWLIEVRYVMRVKSKFLVGIISQCSPVFACAVPESLTRASYCSR